MCIRDRLNSVKFTESNRLTDLIEQICARKESSITGQGHSLAMSLASSKMSPAASLIHRFSGLEGIKQIKSIKGNLSRSGTVENLLGKFEQLHQVIIKSPTQLLSIAEQEQQGNLANALNSIWKSNNENLRGNGDFRLPEMRRSLSEAWTTATQVNFCAKAFPTVASNHKDNACLLYTSPSPRDRTRSRMPSSA